VRGEGFFISAIRKKGITESAYTGNNRMQEFRPSKSDQEVVSRWTDFMVDRILKWGDEIIGIPCDLEEYTSLYKNLKVVKAGTRISVRKKDDDIPSHELAMSVRLKKDSFPVQEISLETAISFLRRDNFTVINIPKGWNIMTYNGINLGFIKNLGNRINNYFPVEWRIRLDASAIRQANLISWH
jgi:NOL1/NOP2/fmu family ribosome biogenesis protein